MAKKIAFFFGRGGGGEGAYSEGQTATLASHRRKLVILWFREEGRREGREGGRGGAK